MPGPVDKYFQEVKKQNPSYSDEKAWATAWSIFCRHKDPGNPHCHRAPSEYLKKEAGQSPSTRVAAQWYQNRYAALRVAMSYGEAKEVLGFPPSANPSPEEIAKAWKSLALKHHPDRGGDLEKMVELNVAKDILDGKSRATWTPRTDPVNQNRPQRPAYKPEPPDATMEGQDFQKAWGDSGVPVNTDWKFCSVPVFYYETHNHPGHRCWVLYGQTDTKHVFLAFKERGASSGTVKTPLGDRTQIMEDWQSSAIMYPRDRDLVKLAPKAIKSLANGWADGAQFKTPTKYYPWVAEGKPTENAIHKIRWAGGVTLKDIMLSTGVLGDLDPSALGRKTLVEISMVDSPERRARMKAEKGRINIADTLDFYLTVGNQKVKLEDDTIKAFERLVIPYVLEWDKLRNGYSKNLTRMTGTTFGTGLKPNARDAIKLVADALTSEPSGIHSALQKAIGEYPEDKRASRVAAAWVASRK